MLDSRPSTDLFVGRQTLLDGLLGELEHASGGRAGAYWLVGEAGMGKTRTSLELAQRAAVFRVLRARCHEDRGSPPFWLWIQVLRSMRAPEAPAPPSPSEARDLLHLLPELTELGLDSAPTQSTEASQKRFLVFDTVVQHLLRWSEKEPLLLILDDLHWSDRSSLLLLNLLVREIPGTRIFVLGTYRNSELAQDRELSETISEIASNPFSHEVVLPPLDREATALIVRSLTDSPPSEPLIDHIYALSEGNPFFIEQLARLLAAQVREASDSSRPRVALPRGVLHSIRRRLQALSPRCLAALRMASVMGREVSLLPLQQALELDSDRTLEALEEARALGVVEETETAGRWRFTHALIQQAVYEELTPLERARMHLRIGSVLESSGAAPSAEVIADLAHHFIAALPVGSLDTAVKYAHRAALNAIATAAYEEGVIHLEKATSLLAAAGREGSENYLELLLDLADAQRLAGRAPEAAAAFRKAFLLADDLGVAEPMARAALGHAEVSFVHGDSNPVIIAELRAALASLPPGDSTTQAMLLARLAVEIAFGDPPGEGDELIPRAIAMARRLGDAATLTYTLIRWHWIASGPEHLEDRTAAAQEILELAERVGDRWMDLEGRAFYLVGLIERGDLERFRLELEEFARRARSLKHPRHLWSIPRWRAVLAAIEGDLEEAQAYAREALDIGSRYVPTQAIRAFTAQFYFLRREQGRLAEVIDGVRSLVQQSPLLTSWRCAWANMELELGNRDTARREVEHLRQVGFAKILTRPYGFAGIAILGEACVRMEDVETCAELYRLIEPHAGMIVETGVGVIAMGTADYFLGLLSEACGDAGRARDHFEKALSASRRLGARPWVARTAARLAPLLATGSARDRARATRLAEEAADLAQRLGMSDLAGNAPRTVAEPVRGPASTGAQVFQRQGDFWTLAFAGRVCNTRDRLGLHYLAELLRHPGRDFHATSLVALVSEAPSGGPASSAAGAMLDDSARRAYQERLRELHEVLEEAESMHDLGRAERAQEEIGALESELRRAFGLGGRPRLAGSPSERARINVTRTIRAALRQIAGVHPELAAHLEATVRTGRYVAYRPDPRVAHPWQT